MIIFGGPAVCYFELICLIICITCKYCILPSNWLRTLILSQDIEKPVLHVYKQTNNLLLKKQQQKQNTNKAAISASKLVALQSKQAKGQGGRFPKPTPPLRTTLLHKENKYHWLLSLICLITNNNIWHFFDPCIFVWIGVPFFSKLWWRLSLERKVRCIWHFPENVLSCWTLRYQSTKYKFLSLLTFTCLWARDYIEFLFLNLSLLCSPI